MRSFGVGLFRLGILVIFCGFFLSLSAKSGAVDYSWTDHPNIKFTKIKDLSSSAEKPTVMAGNNRDCTKRQVVLKAPVIKTVLPDVPAVFGEDCMIDTAFGSVGGNYYLKMNNDLAGPSQLRSKEFLIGGSNLKNAIIGNTSASAGMYVGILRNVNTDIATTLQFDKTLKHELKPTADIQNIVGANQQRLVAKYESIAFSSSGDWMVFDSPYYGLVRVDLNTGQTLSFGEPTDYISYNPGYNLAISSDGRYVAQSRVGMLKIHDLGACSAPLRFTPNLMNCKYRDLEDKRKADTNFGFAPHLLRFSGKDSFTYYTDQLGVNNTISVKQYRVTMGDVPLFGFEYLGLGDSFSSGEGAFDYKTFTQGQCHLSLSSYPYLVAAATNKEKYESVACSGAKTRDVLLNKSELNDYEGQDEDGLNQKQRQDNGSIFNILSSFLPGKITQETFLQNINPEAITISIGGNDIAFAEKIKECVENFKKDSIPINPTCFDKLEERKQVAEEVYALSTKLAPLYTKLKENNRRVYVVGYPKIIKPGGDCAVNVRLNTSETYFADRLTTILNDAVEFAAGQAGVQYVDVENILEGRRLCETNSDNTLVNGVSEARNTSNVHIPQLGKESFHPKADAQALYKNAILAQTNNLAKPMPTPNAPANMSRLTVSDEFFSNLPSTGSTIYKPVYEDFAKDIEFSDAGINVDINFAKLGLAPTSQVKAEIHSTPTVLGTFNTDAKGNLKTTITVPGTVEPGFHSIHFYGLSETGQNVDVYDYVYVGASKTDFDGDGTADIAESCVYVTPIGQDSDQDGTDDACDDKNDPLPVVVPPNDQPTNPPASDTNTPDPNIADTPIENPLSNPEIIDAVEVINTTDDSDVIEIILENPVDSTENSAITDTSTDQIDQTPDPVAEQNQPPTEEPLPALDEEVVEIDIPEDSNETTIINEEEPVVVISTPDDQVTGSDDSNNFIEEPVIDDTGIEPPVIDNNEVLDDITTETEPIGITDPTQPTEPPDEILIEDPIIKIIPDPKTNTSNENQAGNEPINPTPTPTNNDSTPTQTPPTSRTNQQNSGPLQPTNLVQNNQVLGTNEVSPADPNQLENIKNIVASDALPKKTNQTNLMPIFAGGALLFISLIFWLAFALKKRRSSL